MLGESQKQCKRKLEKHNAPKFFMVRLQINIDCFDYDKFDSRC